MTHTLARAHTKHVWHVCACIVVSIFPVSGRLPAPGLARSNLCRIGLDVSRKMCDKLAIVCIVGAQDLCHRTQHLSELLAPSCLHIQATSSMLHVDWGSDRCTKCWLALVQRTSANTKCVLALVRWTSANPKCVLALVRWTSANSKCVLALVRWTSANCKCRQALAHQTHVDFNHFPIVCAHMLGVIT